MLTLSFRARSCERYLDLLGVLPFVVPDSFLASLGASDLSEEEKVDVAAALPKDGVEPGVPRLNGAIPPFDRPPNGFLLSVLKLKAAGLGFDEVNPVNPLNKLGVFATLPDSS